MLALLTTLLLAGGAVAYVALPLVRRQSAEDGEPEVDVLRERQEAAVAALRELDYERQIGKLSDADYFPLRERYARQAMALLKLLDQREAACERALERAIATRRGGAAANFSSARVLPGQVAPPVAGRSRARPVILATSGAMLALVIAVGLLASTIQRGNTQAVPVGQVSLPSPSALAFDPTTPNRLIAADAQSLAESRDAGGTWSPLSASPTAGPLVAIFPAADGQGLAALAAGGKLLQSTDGGRSWSPAPAGTTLPAGAVALALAAEDPPLLFAATGAGVEVSGDNGTSWSTANGFVNGLLPTRAIRDLAYAPTADRSTGPGGRTFRGTLLAATDRGLYVSHDGGQSWLARPLGASLVAVTVDPRRPSVVLVMDEQGRLFRSSDAGATWAGRQ